MKKIQEIHKVDGFVSFDCGIGACPEIKRFGDEYIVRSSRNVQSEIKFTKDLEAVKSVAGDIHFNYITLIMSAEGQNMNIGMYVFFVNITIKYNILYYGL